MGGKRLQTPSLPEATLASPPPLFTGKIHRLRTFSYDLNHTNINAKCFAFLNSAKFIHTVQ